MADRVDRLRRQANMTQQRYAAEAEVLHCSQGTASTKLAGKTRMSERVLWLRLCVTGPTPECGEIVGLRIVDRQAHRTVFDAFFHPVREDGWKSVPAGGVNVNLANRLPLNIYVDGIERILSGATLLRGEHVERDIRFLRAAGVRIEDQVVARSVMVERHKRLASGIAVPTRTGNRACRPIPVG